MPKTITHFAIGKDEHAHAPDAHYVEMPVGSIPMGAVLLPDPRDPKNAIFALRALADLPGVNVRHDLIVLRPGETFNPILGRWPGDFLGVIEMPAAAFAVFKSEPWPKKASLLSIAPAGQG